MSDIHIEAIVVPLYYDDRQGGSRLRELLHASRP
jgi:hypothetical protein